ncbi:outer membrane beta-barrel protein [Vibrio algicola]|uniref:Outer membrane beta-barrel protein n=1 Tax=Vibrio algicola TaxID=2662262 RepID=A0A5Q0TDW2_9VIBR|nr:outer membrane beta-barrel protein [Vibrio algicola]
MKRTLLALALATVATSASADSWLYAGANYGVADYTQNGADNHNVYGLNVGTGILPFIGLEAGYWDLGEAQGSDLSALYLGIKPSINLGPFEFYGKLGANKYDISGGMLGSDDGYDMMYGAGVEYTIFDSIPGGSLSIGAAYNSFGFDKFKANTYTVSATFHFL